MSKRADTRSERAQTGTDGPSVVVRDLLVIDGAAPFFAPVVDGTRQNWSKAPLGALARDGLVAPEMAARVCAELEVYCRRVREIGYTAITFDDLAHLTDFDFYPPELTRLVGSYQALFRRVFRIARDAGLRVLVTTDLMFWNRFIGEKVGESDKARRALCTEAIGRLFERFPEVEGVVTRIGEGDGVDVESAFKSRVVIRTARQCNRWIRAMLPEFESRGKLLIFRTWSLGAYAIGDINWNERTQRRAFGEIDSPAFVVSHKYGPGDFFRHLPLNEFIREGRQAQIIELQARREYEGFGEFPAYVGRQYEALRDALGGCDSLRGISVWCQTGGWSHFDRLTFLDGSSPWNELNAVAAIRLFTSDVGADEVLDEFCAARFRVGEAGRMAELVRQFDHLVDQLWYFHPFARRALWFRRLRVPPLLWIFWDTILVNRAFRLVLHAYHERPKELRKVDKLLRRELWAMRELIADGDAESDGLRRAVETFELLVVLRRFYVGKAGRKRQRKIERKVMAYRERHPAGFGVECDFAPFRIRWVSSWVIFGMLIRGRARYRLFDRLVLIPLSGWLFPWFKRWQRRRIPAVAGRQAAGVEFFFR